MSNDAPHDNSLRREAGMMNLDQLIAQREGLPAEELLIPAEELLARFERLYTGAVNDVLREFCLLDQALPHRITPLREYQTVAGFAFTVKSAPHTRITGEMELRTQMLDAMRPGAFVVWDTSRDQAATLWGGVMTSFARRIGVKAACIDGGIRDTHQILEAEFPVFYEYRTSNGSLGRCLITHYQIPIRIGGVDIRPGDVILGDVDGVLVVPRAMACDVLRRAEQIRDGEQDIFRWVSDGASAQSVKDKGGYF